MSNLSEIGDFAERTESRWAEPRRTSLRRTIRHDLCVSGPGWATEELLEGSSLIPGFCKSKGEVRGEDTEADSCGWEKGKKEIPETRRQRRAEGPQVRDPRQSPARGQASPAATRAPGASPHWHLGASAGPSLPASPGCWVSKPWGGLDGGPASEQRRRGAPADAWDHPSPSPGLLGALGEVGGGPSY